MTITWNLVIQDNLSCSISTRPTVEKQMICFLHHLSSAPASQLISYYCILQMALGQFGASDLSTGDFYSVVMRLLHCHVLPAITLTEEDINRLEDVHAQQERHILLVRIID